MQTIKLNKNSLSLIDLINVSVNESDAFIVDNSLDSLRQDNFVLSFIISPAIKQIPFLKPEEFAVTIREKVDLTAVGPYEKTLVDENKDKGQHNYKDKVPYRPRSLTEGFIELKSDK